LSEVIIQDRRLIEKQIQAALDARARLNADFDRFVTFAGVDEAMNWLKLKRDELGRLIGEN
jgi:hypothetical protein